MSIKTAINHFGVPVTVKEFSFDGLESSYAKDEFAEVVLFKITRYLESAEYRDTNDKYKALIKEIEEKWPECKELTTKLDDIVIVKENDLFAAGFKQGLESLITSMSFNRMYITNNEFIDFEAIDEQRGGAVE